MKNDSQEIKNMIEMYMRPDGQLDFDDMQDIINQFNVPEERILEIYTQCMNEYYKEIKNDIKYSIQEYAKNQEEATLNLKDIIPYVIEQNDYSGEYQKFYTKMIIDCFNSDFVDHNQLALFESVKKRLSKLILGS